MSLRRLQNLMLTSPRILHLLLQMVSIPSKLLGCGLPEGWVVLHIMALQRGRTKKGCHCCQKWIWKGNGLDLRAEPLHIHVKLLQSNIINSMQKVKQINQYINKYTVSKWNTQIWVVIYNKHSLFPHHVILIWQVSINRLPNLLIFSYRYNLALLKCLVHLCVMKAQIALIKCAFSFLSVDRCFCRCQNTKEHWSS